MIYNSIFYFNQDTFNNSTYLSWYNENKRKLEGEISKYESKFLDGNVKESSRKCNEIKDENFSTLKKKIEADYFNSNNCDEYLKLHSSFINNYVNLAQGPEKVKALVNFLIKSKPEFINNFIKQLEKENSTKLEDMITNFKQAEKKKDEAEKRNKELLEETQQNNQRISDLNSELEKKKREIIDLSERIRIIELDIKSRRENIENNTKKAPF